MSYDGWQPIETMPRDQQVLVSDGDLVKPGVRIAVDVIAAPIPMVIGFWSHWRPMPAPPALDARGIPGDGSPR